MSNWLRKLGVAALLLISLLNGAYAAYAEANPLSFVDPEGLAADYRQPRDMQILEGGGGGGASLSGVGGRIGGGAGRGSSPSSFGRADGLPNSALVCRGGLCTADRFAGGSGVSLDSRGNMCGASVNSAADRTLKELSATIPNPKIGVTTVGDVRRLGGDVVPSPTPSKPVHCELCGITPREAERLFTPVIPSSNR